MIQIPIYHVDAFTDKMFRGNPAAVCVLNEWLEDETLHAVARENNLPVTAFLLKNENEYEIRWITPEYELDLCGHGSLSAGFIIFNYLETGLHTVDLHSCSGIVKITHQNNYITLNFPAKSFEKVSLPLLEEGLGLSPIEVYQHADERCLVVYKTEEDVQYLNPNMEILKKIPHRGFTVTAKGNSVDFVSRTFYPHKSISEDPATGASHCLLAPYWSKKLNKQNLHAFQISERQGEMFCQYVDNRVLIQGTAILYMQGIIKLNKLG